MARRRSSRRGIALIAGEILDTAVMRVAALRAFYAEQIADALAHDLLLSLHLKATMMKVSDPVMFGHAVTTYFADLFSRHAETFKTLGVNPRNGLGDVYAKIATLPEAQRAEIEADIAATYAKRPKLAMVDSGKGITNLHVPNDVIIDASMPVVVRDSGRCGAPTGRCTTPRRSSPIAATPTCTRRSSTTAASTGRTTRARWATCRTSG
jgi:isocitrate dehydrogenase